METRVRKLIPRSYNAFFGQFSQLRSAQEKMIPMVIEGKNVLLISPTGSGKTEAVVAPIAERALETPGDLICLYICPTRALVNDIDRRLQAPLAKLNIRAGVRHGDRKTLQGKVVPSILITTPESLDVMLGSKNQEEKDRLRTIQTVIIDEVHQFYQTHRGYQLTLLLERLKRLTKTSLNRILLSATIAEPDRLAHWFQGSDRAFDIVQISGGRLIQVDLDHCTSSDGETYRQGEAIVSLIEPIVQKHNKILLFANSRNECDWLYWRLKEKLSIDVLLHYSTLEKDFRERVERNFEHTDRALCIATSTLELGIDIGNIDAVVMYGAPSTISSFAQRLGRGNRRTSICRLYGLCRDFHIDGRMLGVEHDLLMFYALVSSMQGSELEVLAQGEFPSVYVQQFFSLAYQYDSVVREILERTIKAAHPHYLIDENELDKILLKLKTDGFFTYNHSENAYYPTEKYELVKRSLLIWGNIPSKNYDRVIDAESEIPVLRVPRGSAQPGDIFLFAGEPRLVLGTASGMIKTHRLKFDNPHMIKYDTVGAATPPEVTIKARDILCSTSFPDLPIQLDEGLLKVMKGFRSRFRYFDFDQNIPYERISGRYCYYTFGGSWANTMITHCLRKNGYKVESDSWRIFTSTQIQSFDFLPNEVESLRDLVRKHLNGFVRQFGGSFHFYQLSKDLQHKEICSFLNLGRINKWLQELKQKRFIMI